MKTHFTLPNNDRVKIIFAIARPYRRTVGHGVLLGSLGTIGPEVISFSIY